MSAPSSRFVLRCAASTTIALVVLAAARPQPADAQPPAVRPDIRRIAHTPRAYSLITRIDGRAGYDAAERWVGIAAGPRAGEIVITLAERNTVYCCAIAIITTDGVTATMGLARPALRAATVQQLLLDVLLEGLPLAEGWQGQVDVPEVRSSAGNRPELVAPRLSVPVRVTERTMFEGRPVWRVLAGGNTLYLDAATRRFLGSDETTHLKGHQRQVREKR
jgi:hypothetical protein